jgi:hypothetical protein
VKKALRPKPKKNQAPLIGYGCLAAVLFTVREYCILRRIFALFSLSEFFVKEEVAHCGTAYKITPKTQVDFHFGFGLSPATPGRFFAVGYSRTLRTRPKAS